MSWGELEALPCVAHWKNRIAESTWLVNRYIFRDWLVWMGENGGVFAGMGPCELLEWQRVNHRDYSLLDLVQRYVNLKGGRVGYLGKVYGTIKSFFKHNRAHLPLDSDFRIRGGRVSVRGDFPVDDYRRLLLSFNPLYRAVFLCMSMGLMGCAELLYWSRNGVEDLFSQLDSRERLIKVELPGRKQRRNTSPFYTLIGGDAIGALRYYVDNVRPDGDEIFLTQFDSGLGYKTMSTYWMDHMKRLSIVEKSSRKSRRTGKNIHELRDMGRTRWQFSGADPSVAEFCMGHVVDPNDYNKAYRNIEYARGEYRKAEPWLNVLSQDPERITMNEHLRKLDEYEDLKKRVIDLEEIKRFYEVDRRIEGQTKKL